MAGVAGQLSGPAGQARPLPRTGGLAARGWRLGGVAVAAALLAGALPAGSASAAIGPSSPASARGFLVAAVAAHHPNDQFGFSVALAGSVAAVDAPGVKVGRGAVYVYQRSHGNWGLAATLLGPAGPASSSFGNGVAVYGTTLLVGAPNVNSGDGATYVYHRSRGRWRLQATLADPGSGGDDFGYSLAVSGSWAIIGAPAYSASAAPGSVFIYSISGKPKLRATIADPTDFNGDWFGVSVAISSTPSGTVAVAGSFQDKVDILTKSGGSWQGKLLTGPRVYFGLTVSVSGDAVVLGADATLPDGAAYVYERSGATWRQRAKLSVPHPPAGDTFEFGDGVAISGSRILIGAPITSGSGCDRGYEFKETPSGGWRERALLASPACHGTFGSAMAVSGTTAIIGDSGANDNAGAAYYLALP